MAGLYDGSHAGSVPCLTRQQCRLKPAVDGFEAHFGLPAPVAISILYDSPVEDIDFTATGAYSAYNWELFFHIPLLIAERFRKAQRFSEALRWYHFIFDPRQSGADGAVAQAATLLENLLFYDLHYGDGHDGRSVTCYG